MSKIKEETEKRRTFAIIAHPDAGKTTLTEKLLLFGGAIQLAGMVKAKGEARRAKSDWMDIEKARGISVTASVMTFEYEGKKFNLVDTPGHEDFSEDTYRTLTAVDSAVMIIDGAKGIESQTLKLFEVCRLRDIPIITFINKMDRETRDPFDLMNEIETKLALDITPASWPIGMGRDFKGCYDVFHDRLILMDKTKGDRVTDGIECNGIDDKKIDEMLGAEQAVQLREEVEMIRGLCPKFSEEEYKNGTMTPVYFGSAVNTFGIRELLMGLGEYAPSPKEHKTRERIVYPAEEKVSGFVFKVQANMDPNHRDRIAFMRICSGEYKRGMKLYHTKTNKQITVNNAVMFFARDRELAEEAYAGDIMGIPNHGTLSIGDTLTEGENIRFEGMPHFAPEILRRVQIGDPMKAKHIRKAMEHFAEEGASQIFKPMTGADWIAGVVGELQFEVLKERVKTEYGLEVRFEESGFTAARWIESDDEAKLKKFIDTNKSSIAEDHENAIVFLARNAWHLNRAKEENTGIRFLKTRESSKG
ncbi:MAG: peptide chain release factor 3 [Alphaproteobacteria bacterium]|nr:peptide chain release factor 3 [Alphaproteobacteria bacterium]